MKKEIGIQTLIKDEIIPNIESLQSTTTQKMKRHNMDWLNFDVIEDSKLKTMRSESEIFFSKLLENNSPYWLSLLGGSGTGKTFLAKQLFKRFYEKHRYYMGRPDKSFDIKITQSHNVGFYFAPKLAREFRQGNYSIIYQIEKEHFTVIDDLGSEMDSEFMTSVWFELLTLRLNK